MRNTSIVLSLLKIDAIKEESISKSNYKPLLILNGDRSKMDFFKRCHHKSPNYCTPNDLCFG